MTTLNYKRYALVFVASVLLIIGLRISGIFVESQPLRFFLPPLIAALDQGRAQTISTGIMPAQRDIWRQSLTLTRVICLSCVVIFVLLATALAFMDEGFTAHQGFAMRGGPQHFQIAGVLVTLGVIALGLLGVTRLGLGFGMTFGKWQFDRAMSEDPRKDSATSQRPIYGVRFLGLLVVFQAIYWGIHTQILPLFLAGLFIAPPFLAAVLEAYMSGRGVGSSPYTATARQVALTMLAITTAVSTAGLVLYPNEFALREVGLVLQFNMLTLLLLIAVAGLYALLRVALFLGTRTATLLAR